MTEKERNDQEWRRVEAWRGGILGIYYNPRDTRAWVPKRNPSLGWTLNLAHDSARLWLAVLIGVPVAIVLLSLRAKR